MYKFDCRIITSAECIVGFISCIKNNLKEMNKRIIFYILIMEG